MVHSDQRACLRRRRRIHRAARVAHLKLRRVTGQWMRHGGRQRGLAVHGTLRRRARALAVSPWCLARQAAAGYQVAARAQQDREQPFCHWGLVS